MSIPPEALAPEDRLGHPDDLGALFVNGRRVELLISMYASGRTGGPWAGVFRELRRAQAAHVADALYRAAIEVRGELLVAEDRQALLQVS